MSQPFNPNLPQASIPPELLEAMLGLSEQDEEKQLLERQLALGNMLAGRATGYQGQATGLGGAFSAAAQGLAGYGAGSKIKGYEEASKAGMDKRRGQRRQYFDWMRGTPTQPAATDYDE